jgi:hypothetical protein
MSLIPGNNQHRRKLISKPKFNLSFDKSPKPINKSSLDQSIIYKKQYKPFLPRNASYHYIFSNNKESTHLKKKTYFKSNFSSNSSFQLHNNQNLTTNISCINNYNDLNNNKQTINPLDFTFKNSFFPKQPPPFEQNQISKNHFHQQSNPNKIKFAILGLKDKNNNNKETTNIISHNCSSTNDIFNVTPRFTLNDNKIKKNPIPYMKNNFSLNNLRNGINSKFKKVNNSCCMNGSSKLFVLHPKMKKFFV